MVSVTLTVLEGLERGRVFRNLHTPITIGREEVNSVQLNDERISRLHAKLQDDGGHVIFTDLNSTNGSRINGHPVHLRILRPGDHLQLGRCTVLYGSDEEIAQRAKQLGVTIEALLPLQGPHGRSTPAGGQHDAEFSVADNLNGEHLQTPLFLNERPRLPANLSTLQQAQMSDVLASIHEQLQNVILVAYEHDESEDANMNIPWQQFQNLLLLHRDMAKWLQRATNPDSEVS